MAHRADEASVMPAEAQRLQEPVPSINLEVTATTLGAKHLLIVCEHRQSTGQWFLQDCNPSFLCSRAAAHPRDNLLPGLEAHESTGHMGKGGPCHHWATGKK